MVTNGLLLLLPSLFTGPHPDPFNTAHIFTLFPQDQPSDYPYISVSKVVSFNQASDPVLYSYVVTPK